MGWWSLVALGLVVIACIVAVYQSQKERWERHRKVGTALLLGGAAIGLFLDSVLSVESPMQSWVEPIGAGIMLVGILISWLKPSRIASENPDG